jgi:hypothetical protein
MIVEGPRLVSGAPLRFQAMCVQHPELVEQELNARAASSSVTVARIAATVWCEDLSVTEAGLFCR